MKMQIWRIWITEGVMSAVHGQFFPIYEAYIPDLKLCINYVSSFLDKAGARYQVKPDKKKLGMAVQKDPELVHEFELSREQIEDARVLASDISPHDRLIELISTTLKKQNLDSSNYDDKDKDEEDLSQ